MNPVGRYFLPALLISAAVYLLVQVHHVLLPFVLAATLAYLLNPLINFFEVRGIRRHPAAIGVFFALVATLLVITYVTITVASEQTARVAGDIPLLIRRFQSSFMECCARWPLAEKLLSNSGLLDQEIGALVSGMWGHVSALAMHVLPLLELVFLFPFLALLFMLDGVSFRDTLLGLVPALYVEMLLNLFVEVDNSLGNYLRGICIQAAFMGILAGIGFSIIGLHYSFAVALWVAATSMIPLVGAVSAACAGGIIAFVQWGTWTGVVKVLAISTMIRLVDDWFLQPVILRRAVDIHPALTVFSLMAGGSLFGFWGLLFAVPAICMLKVFLEVAWQWYISEYGMAHFDPAPEVTHIPLI